MKKYTTEPAKVHINSDIETVRNHSIMQNRTDTELSKKYWGLKELKVQPQVQFYMLRRYRPIKRAGICYICLNEKLFIIEHQVKDLVNQRNELIFKCRHKNKFKLMSVFGTFLWYESFSTFELNIETYRVNLRIHSELGEIRIRPTPNANAFHELDKRTLLRYFDTNMLYIYSFNWLDDCDDMKLVVSTRAVLFHEHYSVKKFIIS